MGFKKRLRQSQHTVHLWLGLSLGLYLVAIGLTGAILSFKEPLENIIHPGLHRVSPRPGVRASLDKALAAVQAAHPGVAIGSFAMPKEDGGTILFRLSEKGKTRYAFADPYSAEYLGSYFYDGSPVWWVYELHMNLLLRETGGKTNGILALFGALLLLSGLTLWLPPTLKQLPSRLVFKPNSGTKRRVHDLHNVVGIYALPHLLLMFLTGSAFLYYEPVLGFLNSISGDDRKGDPEAAPPVIVATVAAKRLPLDTLYKAAHARVPNGRVSFIQTAPKPDAPVRIYMDMPDARKNAHGVSISLHPYSGAVLSVEDTHGKTVQGALRTVLNLHFGAWGGTGSHVLYAFAGIAPLVLFTSGLYKWQAKRQGQAANRIRRQQATFLP